MANNRKLGKSLNTEKEKAWIQAKRRDRRVKLTEQVYDPTCLLTFTIVYIAWHSNNTPLIHLTPLVIYI